MVFVPLLIMWPWIAVWNTDIASVPLQARGSSSMLAKCQSCKQPLQLPAALLFLLENFAHVSLPNLRTPFVDSLSRAG